MLDLEELQKAAQTIYLVTDEPIAEDISSKIKAAVKEIEDLRALLWLTSRSYNYTQQKLYIVERNRLLTNSIKNAPYLKYDFRYDNDYNNSTLRINFDSPFGIGSFGFNDEQLRTYIGKDYDFDLFKKCQLLEDQINEIIINVFESFGITMSELDWRDVFEIEIDGIDQNKFSDEIMQELSSKLKGLLK